MTHIIKITSHPTNPDLLILHTPPDLATQMGHFQEARYDPDTHTYLLHSDAYPGLEALANYIDATLHDQRTNSITGQITTPQECRHCAQPARANHPPTYCPSCGNLWDPVGPPLTGDRYAITRTPCPSCGHHQTGRLPHCSHCGQPMTTPPTTNPPATTKERDHLDDPLPLRTTLEDITERLATNPAEAHPSSKGRNMNHTPTPGHP